MPARARTVVYSMRPLALPTFSVSDVLNAFAAKAVPDPVRDKVALHYATFVQQDALYSLHSVGHRWWEFPRTTAVGTLNNEDLKGLYKNEMSDKRGTAFAFYSAIKNSAPHDKCPFCGVGVVSSVDHFLPKSRYSDITVAPANLVPCCNDCNKNKHVRFPTQYGGQLIHPYFDDFTQFRWVKGTVFDEGAPRVGFAVDSNGNYDDEDEKRLLTHFSCLHLARLFGSNAAEALTTERENLVKTAAAFGTPGVRDYLSEQAQKYNSKHLNSWQTAFYEALLASDWFVDGGYLSIPV